VKKHFTKAGLEKGIREKRNDESLVSNFGFILFEKKRKIGEMIPKKVGRKVIFDELVIAGGEVNAFGLEFETKIGVGEIEKKGEFVGGNEIGNIGRFEFIADCGERSGINREILVWNNSKLHQNNFPRRSQNMIVG
jgi:hypothetical protein